MRSPVIHRVGVVASLLVFAAIFILAACSNLRDTCHAWPPAAEARAVDKNEFAAYVPEMRAFIETVVPKMRAAVQANDRGAVKTVQAEVCKFNTRWPIKSPRNHEASVVFGQCFWTTEDTYILGATLDIKPAGGLDYGILLTGYVKGCLEELNKFSPSQ
ncbi:MAG: hypothetical protein JWN73_4412 [Betaproteobacteria bacterium]|nr:hypothetical protein [Betaproteobacteria bacterium]